MKLFIIGNGFDREHGLPTRYLDFRTFLDDTNWQFLMSFEERYSIYPTDTSDPHYQEDAQNTHRNNSLWNELEKNLANIDEDHIVDDAVNIDMGLENEDGILDTLDHYFINEYRYIEQLATYFDDWVRTIDIENARSRTSLINSENEAFYITFNYTGVLETVYNIDPYEILHIHGSIQEGDIAPVLGHGNQEIIDRTIENRDEVEERFDEKATSIYSALQDYYKETFKNISKYMPELRGLRDKAIDEIIVIGHSLSGVDIPYFENIDELTPNRANWKVYYYQPEQNGPTEMESMRESLVKCGVERKRIQMVPHTVFFDLP